MKKKDFSYKLSYQLNKKSLMYVCVHQAVQIRTRTVLF